MILPIDIFGTDFAKMKLPAKDVLGNSLDGEIKNGNLHLKVPAEKSHAEITKNRTADAVRFSYCLISPEGWSSWELPW